MKIKSALKEFVADLQAKNRSISTILAYRKDIEQLIEKTGNKDLKNISQEAIQTFKEGLAKDNYTAKSISRKINALKSFFRFTQAKGFISVDPAVNVAHPKYEVAAPRILTPMEYRALRDACRDDVRMPAIIEMLLQAGIRIGELARLNTDDVLLNKNLFKIKTYQSQSSREVPLNKAAKKALKKYIKARPKSQNKALFLTKTGNPFLVRNIRSAINRYFKMAGIKGAKVNDLRHTFIVQQLAAGVPLTTVSQIVGHKRISTTEKYLTLVEEKGKERIKLEEL